MQIKCSNRYASFKCETAWEAFKYLWNNKKAKKQRMNVETKKQRT